MWLCYLDESGNTGRRLDDADQPVHWIVAVLVSESNALAFADALTSIRREALPPLAGRSELHGSELYSGTGPWAGVEPDRRIATYRSALTLLGEYGCGVAFASIDKPRLAAKYPNPDSPHLLALQFLIEKLDIFFAGQTDPLRQRGLLIADETHEHELFAIDLVARMQEHGFGQVAGRTLTRVVDTVHFVRSETNAGVQLADLVAYLVNRRSRVLPGSTHPADIAITEMYWEHVAPHVRTYRSTWPS